MGVVPLAGGPPGPPGPSNRPNARPEVLKSLILVLLLSSLPPAIHALSPPGRVAVAEELSKNHPEIEITVATLPMIDGDKEPILFRIRPFRTKGVFFLPGRYDILYQPGGNLGLGNYLCDIVSDFIHERRKEQLNFLPNFKVRASWGVSAATGAVRPEVRFELEADQSTLHAIFYAVVKLYDKLKDNYGQFNILVRGFADQGQAKGRQLEQDTFPRVSYLPLAKPSDRLLSLYTRQAASRDIGIEYGNDDLPFLRGAYFTSLVKVFLKACGPTSGPRLTALTLEGAVTTPGKPDHRTVEVFFYAYR